jgi:hypothetical protein
MTATPARVTGHIISPVRPVGARRTSGNRRASVQTKPSGASAAARDDKARR